MSNFLIGAFEGTVEAICLIGFVALMVAIPVILVHLFEYRDYIKEYFSVANTRTRMNAELRILSRQKNRINKKYRKIQMKLRELDQIS